MEGQRAEEARENDMEGTGEDRKLGAKLKVTVDQTLILQNLCTAAKMPNCACVCMHLWAKCGPKRSPDLQGPFAFALNGIGQLVETLTPKHTLLCEDTDS